MRFKKWVLLALLWELVLHAVIAQAVAAPGDNLFDSVSIYEGQGVDHNLLQLPGKIVTGDLKWDQTYFTALGLGKERASLGKSFELFQDTLAGPIRQGYEVVLVQHRGLQSNAEVGGAYTLRTPDLHLGPLGMNFMAGMGFSYALGTPTYEDGTTDDPERRYRRQMLALFEFEWRLRGLEKLSLTARVHHRCGLYGVVAPPQVGSNFIAVGARYYF